MKGPTARRRAAKAGRLKRAENKNKELVRERDRKCRFPLCPCHRWNLFLEVSHAEHKGMGGDPTGERSAPELMLLICNWRHKESGYSIDKKAIRWVPLTAAGANGPIKWEAKVGHEWYQLAHEREGWPLSVTAWGRGVLDSLIHEMTKRFG